MAKCYHSTCSALVSLLRVGRPCGSTYSIWGCLEGYTQSMREGTTNKEIRIWSMSKFLLYKRKAPCLCQTCPYSFPIGAGWDLGKASARWTDRICTRRIWDMPEKLTRHYILQTTMSPVTRRLWARYSESQYGSCVMSYVAKTSYMSCNGQNWSEIRQPVFLSDLCTCAAKLWRHVLDACI